MLSHVGGNMSWFKRLLLRTTWAKRVKMLLVINEQEYRGITEVTMTHKVNATIKKYHNRQVMEWTKNGAKKHKAIDGEGCKTDCTQQT